MAPKGMKRPAAAVAVGGAAKRPASAGSHIEKQCSVVGKALLAATEYHETVREMLASSLGECLGMPKEARHRFQEQVAEMVGEALASVEAGLQAALEASEAKLVEATNEKATREAAEQDAGTQLAEKSEAVQAAKAAQAESTAALKASKVALSSAEAEQKAGDAELEAAAAKQAKLESTVAETYAPLKEGALGAKEAKESLACLLKLGKEFSFDSSLLTSVPTVLNKAPADRGNFDAMVLDQVEAEISRCKETLSETIAKGEPGKSERAAKVTAAACEHASAGEAEQACKAALEAAKKAQVEAVEAQKAAKKAVQQLGPELAQATAECEAAKTKLQELRDGALAAFKELHERSAEAPAEAPAGEAAAEEAAEKEAPAEEAAAEEQPPQEA